MLQATFKKHTFQFKQPGGTSRGILKTKDSWYIILHNANQPGINGIGECSIIKNLSIDDRLMKLTAVFLRLKKWSSEKDQRSNCKINQISHLFLKERSVESSILVPLIQDTPFLFIWFGHEVGSEVFHAPPAMVWACLIVYSG